MNLQSCRTPSLYFAEELKWVTEWVGFHIRDPVNLNNADDWAISHQQEIAGQQEVWIHAVDTGWLRALLLQILGNEIRESMSFNVATGQGLVVPSY
jgi:hypothetical protein